MCDTDKGMKKNVAILLKGLREIWREDKRKSQYAQSALAYLNQVYPVQPPWMK